jgi:hypothetical protein
LIAFRIIAWRNLHLQPAQADFVDAPRVLHQVAKRSANLEFVDGDERRHVGSTLMPNHDTFAADSHAREHATLERLDRDFALELLGQQGHDFGLQGLRAQRN